MSTGEHAGRALRLKEWTLDRADEILTRQLKAAQEIARRLTRNRQQFAVYAHYTDGTVTDVTPRAQYESTQVRYYEDARPSQSGTRITSLLAAGMAPAAPGSARSSCGAASTGSRTRAFVISARTRSRSSSAPPRSRLRKRPP